MREDTQGGGNRQQACRSATTGGTEKSYLQGETGAGGGKGTFASGKEKKQQGTKKKSEGTSFKELQKRMFRGGEGEKEGTKTSPPKVCRWKKVKGRKNAEVRHYGRPGAQKADEQKAVCVQNGGKRDDDGKGISKFAKERGRGKNGVRKGSARAEAQRKKGCAVSLGGKQGEKDPREKKLQRRRSSPVPD